MIRKSVLTAAVIFFVFVALAWVSCSPPKASDQLIGRFSADYEYASEVLDLHSDGSFDQTVKLKQAKREYSAHGKWRFDPSRRELSLDGHYMEVIDGLGKPVKDFEEPSDATFGIYVTRFFGRIRLGSSEDFVVYSKE